MKDGMHLHPSFICLIALACFAFPARAQPPGDDATRAQFLGQPLQLHEEKGRCRLVSGDGELDLLLDWPCRFHLDTHGALRTRQVGDSHVLLVESSEALPASSRNCRTTLQAVRSGRHGLEASPAVSRVATCPPFEWDEKVFIGLFENGDENGDGGS